jgi:hypothetical protein
MDSSVDPLLQHIREIKWIRNIFEKIISVEIILGNVKMDG